MRDGPASTDESLPETEASASTGARPAAVGRRIPRRSRFWRPCAPARPSWTCRTRTTV